MQVKVAASIVGFVLCVDTSGIAHAALVYDVHHSIASVLCAMRGFLRNKAKYGLSLTLIMLAARAHNIMHAFERIFLAMYGVFPFHPK